MSTVDDPPHIGTNHCTIGGGCFWCLDALFRRVHGVQNVISGYAGGETTNPTYEAVCSGITGHAEVIRIAFDSNVVTFDQLLELFWRAHDPTTLNRQGADVGTQYRSIILAESPEQFQAAKASMHTAQSNFARPIVTEIAMLGVFYPGETYHQNFAERNPAHPYCRAVIFPKLTKIIPEK